MTYFDRMETMYVSMSSDREATSCNNNRSASRTPGVHLLLLYRNTYSGGMLTVIHIITIDS